MDELIGIYKGLRLPLLGFFLMIITAYIFWPSRKGALEQAKYDMLEDEPRNEHGTAHQESK